LKIMLIQEKEDLVFLSHKNMLIEKTRK